MSRSTVGDKPASRARITAARPSHGARVALDPSRPRRPRRAQNARAETRLHRRPRREDRRGRRRRRRRRSWRQVHGPQRHVSQGGGGRRRDRRGSLLRQAAGRVRQARHRQGDVAALPANRARGLARGGRGRADRLGRIPRPRPHVAVHQHGGRRVQIAHRRVPPHRGVREARGQAHGRVHSPRAPGARRVKGRRRAHHPGDHRSPRDAPLCHQQVLRAQGLERALLAVQDVLPQRRRAEGGHPRHPRRALHRMRRQAPRQGRHPGGRGRRRVDPAQGEERDGGRHRARRAVGRPQRRHATGQLRRVHAQHGAQAAARGAQARVLAVGVGRLARQQVRLSLSLPSRWRRRRFVHSSRRIA